MKEKLKILILEDVPEDAELMERELHKEKISFVSYKVDNKQDFLKGLKDFKPDIILSDYFLPQFNGLEALELVKEKVPGIPFIIVTGSINEETAVDCMKNGAWNYVIKENLTRLGYAVKNALKLKAENDKKKQAEEALQESEEKIRHQNEFLNTVLESLTHPFYVVDAHDYTLTIANSACGIKSDFKKVTCHSVSHRTEKPCLSQRHPCPLEIVKKTKKPTMVEHIHFDKDGNERNIEVHGFPIFDKKGNVDQMIEYCLDITERKKAEGELHESEEKFRSFIETSTDLVFRLTKTGRFDYISPRVKDLYGYQPDELIGKHLKTTTPVREIPRAIKELNMVFAGKTLKNFEINQKTKAGRIISMEINAVPAYQNGKIIGLHGIMRDITERKQAEEERKIIIHDREERIKELNCLYSLVDSINKRTHLEEILQDMANFIPSGWQYPDITRCRVRFDGKEYVSADFKESNLKQSSKIIVNGETYGSIDVYYIEEWPELDEGPFMKEERDLINTLASNLSRYVQRKFAEEELLKEKASLSKKVKERTADLSKANAELAKAAKMKDEFLASMSHELRTPLNAVLGLSEALQEEVYGEMNKKQHKSLKSIEESGRHLLSLINDILDIAKIEAGKVSLEINQAPIEGVCQASLRLVKQMALQKNIQITSNIKTSLLTFGADERRLKQILVNLLSNAVKFTPKGGEVGIEVADDFDKERINFTVWDTGIGIAKESMDKLFQPFEQIDSSLTREYSGTGLGLSLVKHLTELHGGCVTVESEPGEGSRFTIALPVREIMVVPAIKVEEGDEKPGKIKARKPQEIIEGKALILIAEDNEKNIEMVSDYLLAKGYSLMIARNGKETIKVAKEQTPDLILMDIQMPVMDGLEATRIIRNDKDTKLAKVPVIALTALAMPGDKEKCLAAGVDDYIKKPAGLKYLVKKIEELLKP